MGSLFSYLWWGGVDPDAVNSETGLSARDINNLKTSWSKVTADSIGSGAELLIRYFSAHPEYKKFFKTFKDIPTEELRSNRQFQAHCLNIITSFTNIIDNLHKPDLATVMCKKLGTSHSKRSIKELHFNDIKDVLVKLFIDLKFSEATMGSWVKFVTYMFTHIFSELDKNEL